MDNYADKRRLRRLEQTDWKHLPPNKITAWYAAVDQCCQGKAPEKTRHGKKITLMETNAKTTHIDSDGTWQVVSTR